MVHRFQLLLVAVCLSLELWGLKETTAVQASPVQPRLAASSSVQSNSVPAKAGVKPKANKTSSAPASPVSASPTQPAIKPAANPPAASPAQSELKSPSVQNIPAQNPSDANSSGTNQLGWLLAALLLASGGLVVGRHFWQRRSFHSSRNSSQQVEPDSDPHPASARKPDAASTQLPAMAPTDAQIAPLNSQIADAPGLSSQPVGRQGSESSSDIQASEPINLTPTARLAKVDIVEALITDLHHSDATKRRKAVWELGQRGDSRAIQPLVDLLVDADSQQRSLILAAIAEISTRTLKPMNRALLISLQDESADVRKNAIRDITRVYDLITQVSQLVQYAASDTDAEVQETARWALGQLNRLRSLPQLSELEPSASNSAAKLNRRDTEDVLSHSVDLPVDVEGMETDRTILDR